MINNNNNNFNIGTGQYSLQHIVKKKLHLHISVGDTNLLCHINFAQGEMFSMFLLNLKHQF